MSIYRESKADILSYFNRKYGLSLKLTDVAFSAGIVNDNSSYSTANSKCKITITNAAINYQGSTIVYYNRDDIGAVIALGQPTNPFIANSGDSVYNHLADITACTGLVFTTADLTETFVAVDSNNVTTLALTAKSTSVGWIGTGTITLGAKPTLASKFTTDYIVGS